MNLEQKWTAFELLSRHETGAYRIIAAVLHECKEEDFAKLRIVYPDEIEAALAEGSKRRKRLRAVLDRAVKVLIEHPAKFAELGEMAERLLELAENGDEPKPRSAGKKRR